MMRIDVKPSNFFQDTSLLVWTRLETTTRLQPHHASTGIEFLFPRWKAQGRSTAQQWKHPTALSTGKLLLQQPGVGNDTQRAWQYSPMQITGCLLLLVPDVSHRNEGGGAIQHTPAALTPIVTTIENARSSQINKKSTSSMTSWCNLQESKQREKSRVKNREKMGRDNRNPSRGRNRGRGFNRSRSKLNTRKPAKENKPKKTLSYHIYYVLEITPRELDNAV